MGHTARDFVRYNVKCNRVIRRVFGPIMSRRYQQVYKEYLRSPYPEMLRSYKGKYAGKRCFIIGNGPSLTVSDLELLRGEYTFAANRIYDLFDRTDWRPAFYVAIDGYFIDDNYDSIYAWQMPQRFLEYRNIKDMPRNEDTIALFRLPFFETDLWDMRSIYISEDIPAGFSDGYTVTFASIQLALYMGFSEINLLGVDFNYSITRDAKGHIHRDESVQDYFSGQKNTGMGMNYESNLRAYRTAKTYCDAHGVTIRNVTRGGKLEVFDRVALESVIGGGNF